MKQGFLLSPVGEHFDALFPVIKSAVQNAGSEVGEEFGILRILDLTETNMLTTALYGAIKGADFVVADLSGRNSNVMYELGYAHALGKPTVMLTTQDSQIPFDIANFRFIRYNADLRGLSDFSTLLTNAVIDVIRNPTNWLTLGNATAAPLEDRPSVFISYSHADAAFLTRLRVHLRPLEKANVIDLWDDQKIRAGAKWKSEIERALARAVIAVLLVSADFLASDFIVDNELPPLLQAAEKKGTVILPVIVKPCRFIRDKNLSQFQAINDPRLPLFALSEPDQETLYARVGERIESELRTIMG